MAEDEDFPIPSLMKDSKSQVGPVAFIQVQRGRELSPSKCNYFLKYGISISIHSKYLLLLLLALDVGHLAIVVSGPGSRLELNTTKGVGLK
jgi:hypothetical protein